MKKIIALVMALTLAVAFVACGEKAETTAATTAATTVATTVATEEVPNDSKVTNYAEFVAAEVDTAVEIETYVQATQSWWNDQITVYTQNQDGGIFVYNMVCSEADAAKLVPGTKIKVTGFKTEWRGEIEIAEGATFEFVEGGDTFIAEAIDATALLGTDELVEHQNQFVAFKGLTVVPSVDANNNEKAFLYNWDGSGSEGTDSDLYFNVTDGTNTYTFVVEYYLCNESTDVYKAVQALNVGDVVDVEGFVYWYEAVQPHITSLTVVK